MDNAGETVLAKLQRLSPEQRRLLFRASLVLSAASAAVALMPFRHAIRFGCVASRGRRVDVSECVWAVQAASIRLPWRTMCIEQGLAVQRMLRRGGVDAVLHYGARLEPSADKLGAHVWVSVDGHAVIGGEEAPSFAEVAVFS